MTPAPATVTAHEHAHRRRMAQVRLDQLAGERDDYSRSPRQCAASALRYGASPATVIAVCETRRDEHPAGSAPWCEWHNAAADAERIGRAADQGRQP